MEQYIRDAKIDTLYEGTTGIQALDLFFRKIARDQGQTLMRFSERSSRWSRVVPMNSRSNGELLGKALEDVQAHIGAMVGYSMASMQRPEQIYKTGLHTTKLAGEPVRGRDRLVVASPCRDRAVQALPEASEPRTRTSTRARSPRRGSSPGMPSRRRGCGAKAAEAEDGTLMELPVEAF